MDMAPESSGHDMDILKRKHTPFFRQFEGVYEAALQTHTLGLLVKDQGLLALGYSRACPRIGSSLQ